MGYVDRIHFHTDLAADTPPEVLAWLRGEGDAASMLAVVPSPDVRSFLAELVDWRPPLKVSLEEVEAWTGADPTPRTWGHRLVLSGRIHDDSVMIGYGLAAMLATYADEGMIGVSWTDMHQESDPTIFLVQQGRLYLAKRHDVPRHATLDGVEEVPWQPFPIGDPEAGR